MYSKNWNWKHKKWPYFTFDREVLQELELNFSQNTGMALGILKHLRNSEKDDFLVHILSNEALKSSEIEGEFLDRVSVQSSIKKNLGLITDKQKVSAAEFGIAEMRVDLYKNYHLPISHQQLFEWHKMLTNGRRDLDDIGKYRTHYDPMQIVSGRLDKPIVHFEAPPSNTMQQEMNEFMRWFNHHHFTNTNKISPLAKAGIAHFHFVTIHPFEDGNGRIGRAIAEKSIALSVGKPTLLLLSQTINSEKKAYYASLEKHNTTLDITDWLVYFGNTIIKAQENTLKELEFLIQKARFFDAYSSQINTRQLKVIQRIFKEGHTGFVGGLSAKNYMKITKTSASTATRDLKELVDKKILSKTGSLKSTRYHLNLE